MEHPTHENHTHEHKAGCGHTAIRYNGHTAYVHDDCLHYPHENHVDEYRLEARAECSPRHACDGHETDHQHGPNCGHEAIPHGDHYDYIVDGHIHHPHEDHCDLLSGVEVVG